MRCWLALTKMCWCLHDGAYPLDKGFFMPCTTSFIPRSFYVNAFDPQVVCVPINYFLVVITQLPLASWQLTLLL